MDMVAILFNGPEPFEQIGKTFQQKAYVKSGENLLKQFHRRRRLKINTILYMNI